MTEPPIATRSLVGEPIDREPRVVRTSRDPSLEEPTLRRASLRFNDFDAGPSHGYNLGNMQGLYQASDSFTMFPNMQPTSTERLVEQFPRIDFHAIHHINKD